MHRDKLLWGKIKCRAKWVNLLQMRHAPKSFRKKLLHSGIPVVGHSFFRVTYHGLAFSHSPTIFQSFFFKQENIHRTVHYAERAKKKKKEKSTIYISEWTNEAIILSHHWQQSNHLKEKMQKRALPNPKSNKPTKNKFETHKK